MACNDVCVGSCSKDAFDSRKPKMGCYMPAKIVWWVRRMRWCYVVGKVAVGEVSGSVRSFAAELWVSPSRRTVTV